MPRKGKGGGHGGARNGTPGVAHPQRTDLNTAMLNETAPSEGREFGAVARDEAALEAVPMGSPTGGGQPAPAGGPLPGELNGLRGPSMRPDVPITNGIPLGPGRGPEVLRSNPVNRGRTVLDGLAQSSNDPFLRHLAMKAKTRG